MPIVRVSGGTPLDQLVYPRERILYGVMVAISLAVYGGLAMWGLSQPESGASLLVYAVIFHWSAGSLMESRWARSEGTPCAYRKSSFRRCTG